MVNIRCNGFKKTMLLKIQHCRSLFFGDQKTPAGEFSFKVERGGKAGNVFAGGSPDVFGIQYKCAGIVAEVKLPSFAECGKALIDEQGVIPLYIEYICHPLTVAEGGRVHDDKVEAFRRQTGEVLFYISMDEPVAATVCKPVELHIAFGPVEVGLREVNGHHFCCTSAGGIY